MRDQYDIEFRGTKSHGNADALFRVPLHIVNQPKDERDHYTLSINQMTIMTLLVCSTTITLVAYLLLV